MTGCVQGSAVPTSTPSGVVTSGTAGSASSPTPTVSADPVFSATGSAEMNRAFFDLVNNRLFTANGTANGRNIIDNLVSSGFVKADMQVTPDATVGGHQVDSILFAVRIGAFCLLGQHGGGGYASSVQPVLTSGGPCLIGTTRAIDW